MGRLLIVGVVGIAACSVAFAQEERRSEEREGGFLRLIPVMVALDADGDGEVSAKELESAVASLKKLDKNNDGKLSADELRPTGGFGRGPGGEGRGPFGEGREGRGPGGEGGFGGPSVNETVERLMASDKNGDGKLSKDEIPQRMQAVIERADENKDGVVTKEELTKMASAQAGRGGPGGRDGYGPPSPEQFINSMMEFDADNDGKLSREELAKMAAERRGPGIRGRGEGEGRRTEGGEGRFERRPDGGRGRQPERGE